MTTSSLKTNSNVTCSAEKAQIVKVLLKQDMIKFNLPF